MGVNTYYFDASDGGPTDPNSAWSFDDKPFNGNEVDHATGSTAGSTSSNYLKGDGTNAPPTGESIIQVRARILCSQTLETDTASAAIYSDSLAELLGTALYADTGYAWGDYVTLSTPSGGWTWPKVQALETKLYITSTPDGSIWVYKIGLEVTTSLIGPFPTFIRQ